MPSFNVPLSDEKADRLIDLLELPANALVLDVGCGQGEFLIRVLQRYQCRGVGIDLERKSLEIAIKAAEKRLPCDVVEFREANIREIEFEAANYDLAICLGSTHAFASGSEAYPQTLRRMSDAVKPGGMLLVGEGYWKQPPDAEYLKVIGEPVGIYHDHAGNVSLPESLGWTTLYAAVSNDDEWDHFEWSHRTRIERELAGRSEDPARQEKLHRSREWQRAFLKWGRETMGFGFYLFAKLHNAGP